MYTVHSKSGAVLATAECPMEANRLMRRLAHAEYWCLPDGRRGGRVLRVAHLQPIQWDRAPMGTFLPTGWGA